METIFINTENSKMNESHKFVLKLSQKWDLRSPNKHVALQNLTFYHNWKKKNKKTKQYKNNELKTIAPTWNDEFKLPDSSYSVGDIQDYMKYITKNHGTLTAISSIHNW